MPSEKFWLDDIIQFFSNTSTIMKIIPQKNMNLIEQMNSVFRFSIYFSLIVFIIHQDIRTFFFAVFVGFFTIFIKTYAEKENSDKKQILEKMHIGEDKQGRCVLPTYNNPFMNVTLKDRREFPNRPPACNVTKNSVKNKMEEEFNKHGYRDIGDIYGKNNSYRQFYTMPVTTIPNNQKEFAEALYMKNPTVVSNKQRHNNYKIY